MNSSNGQLLDSSVTSTFAVAGVVIGGVLTLYLYSSLVDIGLEVYWRIFTFGIVALALLFHGLLFYVMYKLDAAYCEIEGKSDENDLWNDLWFQSFIVVFFIGVVPWGLQFLHLLLSGGEDLWGGTNLIKGLVFGIATLGTFVVPLSVGVVVGFVIMSLPCQYIGYILYTTGSYKNASGRSFTRTSQSQTLPMKRHEGSVVMSGGRNRDGSEMIERPEEASGWRRSPLSMKEKVELKRRASDMEIEAEVLRKAVEHQQIIADGLAAEQASQRTYLRGGTINQEEVLRRTELQRKLEEENLKLSNLEIKRMELKSALLEAEQDYHKELKSASRRVAKKKSTYKADQDTRELRRDFAKALKPSAFELKIMKERDEQIAIIIRKVGGKQNLAAGDKRLINDIEDAAERFIQEHRSRSK